MIATLQDHALEIATRMLKPLFTSSRWAKVKDELEEWNVSLLSSAFKETSDEVAKQRVKKQSAWNAICASVRADPLKCLGFPVLPDVLPNAQNTAALKSLSEISNYTTSHLFVGANSDGITKAIATKSQLAAPWELQKRQDVFRGILASLSGAMMLATATGPMHASPMPAIVKVADTVVKMDLEHSATKAYMKTAISTKQVESLKGEASTLWTALATEQEALDACCDAFRSEVKTSIISGLQAGLDKKNAELDVHWKESLISDVSPGSVEKFLVGSKAQEIIIGLATATVRCQTLLDKWSDIEPELSESERKPWNEFLNECRLFTCMWSLWQMMLTKNISPRARQTTADSKNSKVKAQLGDTPIPADVQARVSKWVKHGDAFSKKV